MEKQNELERKLQHKKEVIDLQIEVLDEYRGEILRLNRVIEKKDQIILNLKNLINESNRSKQQKHG
jgi:hypothetical protein